MSSAMWRAVDSGDPNYASQEAASRVFWHLLNVPHGNSGGKCSCQILNCLTLIFRPSIRSIFSQCSDACGVPVAFAIE